VIIESASPAVIAALITAGADPNAPSTDGQTMSQLAAEARVARSYFTRILCLSFLAPDIVKAILRDRHPIELTAKRLANELRLPIAWDERGPRPLREQSASEKDHAEPSGMRDGAGAADCVELVDERADVKLGGMDGDAEPAGNYLVRRALGEQSQYLEFAGR